jgi:uncharacterized protein
MSISPSIRTEMEKKIIGRDLEKAKLDELLQSNEPEFLALYGRRRVGKTFLIRQYLKNQIVFDLSGSKDGGTQEQLHNFFTEYLLRTDGKAERKAPSSWQEAFFYLAIYLKNLPPTENKHVVFLDEMPWMDAPKSGFVSALEFFWNQYVSRMDHVLLIACGSASSWIRKKLINARGGLYNRVTSRLKLRAFNLHETELYLQNKGIQLTHYQLIELYMVMGGVPFYLKAIKRGKSVPQLIDEICFSPQGALAEEYGQLYHSLFRNAEWHVALVEQLAAHPQGMTRKALTQATKLSEGNLSRTLEELIECDFVMVLEPLLNRKKETIYKLIDLYSLFYLKFINANQGTGKQTWEQLSKSSSYQAWSGYAFENIAILHLPQIKAALGISGVFTRHNSWKFKGNDELPGTQIDLIIDREDRVINLCEAKFTQENYIMNAAAAAQMRQRKMIFKDISQTKKLVLATLLSTYPAIKNQHYLSEIDSEVTMDKLFLPDPE